MSPSSSRREPDAPGVRHDFDEVYLSGRRAMLLQAVGLCGDGRVATRAVSEAYAAAARRWRRVGRLPDPDGWVRARVLERAVPPGRRLRSADATEPPAPVAPDPVRERVRDALGHLDPTSRRALVLAQLGGLGATAVAGSLDLPVGEVEDRLLDAREQLADLPEGSGSLDRLAALVDVDDLPPPEQLRGASRRRTSVRAAIAAVVVLVLLAGALLVWPAPLRDDVEAQAPDTSGTASDEPGEVPVEASMLLQPEDLALLEPGQTWTETSTGDNTEGDGINTVCQASRFADPEGEGTLVRTFASSGDPARTVLQTVEVSSTTTAAVDAYATTLEWFAGCREARLQLLGSYRVTGLGARAEVLELRVPTPDQRRTYVVGVVRTGNLTVSTVTETRSGAPVRIGRAARVLRQAVERLCGASAAGSCPQQVEVSRVLPPLSGEARGTLATADLPPIGQVVRPWVGTRPSPARPNLASTSCDRANFVRNGADQARSRTFLIPRSRLPDRFGLTQTVGQFPRPARAAEFVDGIIGAMARCEDEDLSAQVQEVVLERDGFRGSTIAVWRLDSEVAEDETVGFWMALARVGPYVSQVLFTPTAGGDLDADQFRAVAARARDRLFELTGGPR